MKFDELIKKERIKQGMSQKKLAEAAGVTIRAIAYWENGQRLMSVENADKVFKALNIQVVLGAQGDTLTGRSGKHDLHT